MKKLLFLFLISGLALADAADPEFKVQNVKKDSMDLKLIENTLSQLDDPFTKEPSSANESEIDQLISSMIGDTEAKQGKSLGEPFAGNGLLTGKVVNHKGEPMANVQTLFFRAEDSEDLRSMLTTRKGTYAYYITSSNYYTLTAHYKNQFFFTNMVLMPGHRYDVNIRFVMPMTIYGKLTVDGEDAQRGVFLRLMNQEGAQAGGLVVTNGLFCIKDITPGRYTMVLERRKRFIDERINEGRFYYFPITLTNEGVRISVDRDRRDLYGYVLMDGNPLRHLDARVILRDARSNGMLIHMEADTYSKEGFYIFKHVQPGVYYLEALHGDKRLRSQRSMVTVKPKQKKVKTFLNLVSDPNREKREMEQLKRQFTEE
jgi:hypothetical protein